MAAYYNENDPYAVAWLKNLIRLGVIPNGDVDDRDIQHVQPADLVGYRQCHFFAGIGGWPFAVRLADWPDERELWTGSCPCTPHSSAAHGAHVEPDLWEPFRRLIAARSPRVVFGEQVANAGRWFDGVCDDLEALDYTVAAAILPACSVGRDHARARLFFVSHAHGHCEPSRAIDAEASGVPIAYRGHARSVALPHGVSARVAQLRAFGNAIVPAVAAEFVAAYMEIVDAKE